MTHKRANSSVEYRNLHMLSSVVLYNTARKPKVQQEYIFHPQEIGKIGSFGINHCPLCFASGLWQAHIPLLKIVIGLCHKKPTGQNHFYTERKVKKQAFQRCLWKGIQCMLDRDMAFWILSILRILSKNQHGNLVVSTFVGFTKKKKKCMKVNLRGLEAITEYPSTKTCDLRKAAAVL